MSHKYTDFEVDDVLIPLPQLNPVQTHDPLGMRSTLYRSAGGLYDARGTGIGDAQPRTLPVRGVYVGQIEYIGDENGDYLVDEDDNYIIAAEAIPSMRAQLELLKEAVRKRGTLWRVRLEDETVREWKTARLLDAPHTIDTRNAPFVAEVNCQFDTMMEKWHAESMTTVSTGVSSGSPGYLIADNSGSLVEDAVLSIRATSGTITAVTIVCAALGINLEWAGALEPGESLVIDASETPDLDGVEDAYDGFSYGGDHTAEGWILIPVGQHVFAVTVTGGNAEITLDFYYQVA